MSNWARDGGRLRPTTLQRACAQLATNQSHRTDSKATMKAKDCGRRIISCSLSSLFCCNAEGVSCWVQVCQPIIIYGLGNTVGSTGRRWVCNGCLHEKSGPVDRSSRRTKLVVAIQWRGQNWRMGPLWQCNGRARDQTSEAGTWAHRSVKLMQARASGVEGSWAGGAGALEMGRARENDIGPRGID